MPLRSPTFSNHEGYVFDAASCALALPRMRAHTDAAIEACS